MCYLIQNKNDFIIDPFQQGVPWMRYQRRIQRDFDTVDAVFPLTNSGVPKNMKKEKKKKKTSLLKLKMTND